MRHLGKISILCWDFLKREQLQKGPNFKIAQFVNSMGATFLSLNQHDCFYYINE